MLRIVGRFGYRPLYKDEVDLCQLLAAAGTPCPVPTTVASWSIQRILQMRAIAVSDNLKRMSTRLNVEAARGDEGIVHELTLALTVIYRCL